MCLLGVQVAVEREGWMVIRIDDLIMAYFKGK